MDKDLFNDNIKNAFDNFEADPPEYILERVKSTYNKGNSTQYRTYRKVFIITSLIAMLSVPFYFIINKEDSTTKIEPDYTTPQQISTTNTNSSDIINLNKGEVAEKKINPDLNKNISNPSQESLTTFAGEDKIICGLRYKLEAENKHIKGKWSISNSGTDKVAVNFVSSDDPNSVVTVSEPGKYTFKWTVEQDGSLANDEVLVEFIEMPNHDAGKDMTICESECELNSTGASGTWISPVETNLLSPNNPKSIVRALIPGIYSFIWEESYQICKSYDTVIIQFVEPPEIVIHQISFPVCSNDRIEIRGAVNSLYKANWNFYSGSAMKVNDKKNNKTHTETYSVSWTDSKAHRIKLSASYKSCSDEVILDIPSTKTLQANYRNSFPGDEIPSMIYFSNLTIIGEYDFEDSDSIEFMWHFGDGKSSSDPNPDHIYLYPGLYHPMLIASTIDGCTDTIKGEVIDISYQTSSKQQNILTPNGDGENDFFRINSDGFKNFTCIILSSRTSKKLYEWSDPNGKWDGRIYGRDFASTGMYYYIIKGQYHNNKPFEIPGVIYLIRE